MSVYAPFPELHMPFSKNELQKLEKIIELGGNLLINLNRNRVPYTVIAGTSAIGLVGTLSLVMITLAADIDNDPAKAAIITSAACALLFISCFCILCNCCFDITKTVHDTFIKSKNKTHKSDTESGIDTEPTFSSTAWYLK